MIYIDAAKIRTNYASLSFSNFSSFSSFLFFSFFFGVFIFATPSEGKKKVKTPVNWGVASACLIIKCHVSVFFGPC